MDLNINTKFEVGQEVYYVRISNKSIEQKKTCGVCLGVGTFIYNGYKCNCPKCGGRGEIVTDKRYIQINTVDDIKWRITSIKITVDRDKNIIVRYVISPITNNNYYGYSKTTAFAEELFPTLEEAQLYCNEQNSIQMGDIANA